MLNEQILEAIRAAVAAQSPDAGTHDLQFEARSGPFVLPVGLRGGVRPTRDVSHATREAGADANAADGENDASAKTEDDAPGEYVDFHLSGVASSTSVDWYGTEMSRPCLDDMAVQFEAGVEVFVGHGSWLSGLEWNDAIGVTDGAEVSDAEVANAADPKEKGAILAVEMHFQTDADTSERLCGDIRTLRARVRKGLPTGLSIGGWFRRIQYIVDAEGELSRIIIDKVDLDHLATTRRPANPDSLGLTEMRSVLGEAIRRARPAAIPATPAAVEPEPVREEPAARVAPAEPLAVRSVPALDPMAPSAKGDATQDATSHRAEHATSECKRSEADCGEGCDCSCGCDGVGCEDTPDCACSCHGDRSRRSAPPPHVHVHRSPESPPTPPPAVPAEPSPELRAPKPDTQEHDMTPEEIKAMIDQAIADTRAAVSAEQTAAAQNLADANQRRGIQDPPAPRTGIQPPPGADVVRSKAIVRNILSAPEPSSMGTLSVGQVLRSVHFGETDIGHARATSYREPSGARQKALWLGLSHELRAVGMDQLADVAADAAPILGLDVRGLRGLRPEADDDKATIDNEARELLRRSLNAAASEGHPVFKEPGTREAATRALTVSATSDKVTTALVSSLLQQLSNIQLGARTQLRRIPGAGTSYVTPKRAVSNTLAEFIADGTAPTEDSGTWSNDTWNYKTLATRMRVTRKAEAQGAQWGDLMAAEALLKGEDYNRQEEVAIFQGDTVHSLPTANGFDGLLTLIGVNSGQTVANTTANAGDSINLAQLDKTINKVRGREMKQNMRIFTSEQGGVRLDAVLQAQQTFQNTVMAAAGFVVQTYKGIAVIPTSGIPDVLIWNGASPKITTYSGSATTAIVVVNLQHVYMVVLTPVTLQQVATTTAQYMDFEMFSDEVLVLDNLYGAAQLGGILA